MTLTFLRLRPASTLTGVAAASRWREGTTAIETSDVAVAETALEGGLLSIGQGLVAAFLHGVEEEIGDQIPGWRLTLDSGSASFEKTLDAVARQQPAFLRAGRGRVEELARIVALPGNNTSLSVFVDDVDSALAAVAGGATDLLLRDWDGERIGQLRDQIAAPLVERTVFPLGVSIDTVRSTLPSRAFKVWLDQVDGSGAVRPRWEWAPGKAVDPPVPPRRLSAQWSDPGWVNADAPGELAAAGNLRPILERSLEGSPPSREEIEQLFGARGAQVEAIAFTADELRRAVVGDTVTYVINRNINYTNQCYFRCGFCAFSKGPRSLNLREEPYLIPLEGIVGLAEEAWERGATEVTLQGGIHPQFTGDFYASVVEGIKAKLPHMHIHGFTPLEVWQGAETLGVSVRSFLTRLRDAGLGSLPGTAAEVLDDRVRLFLCPDKIRTAQWAEVMITAHELGLRATATLMFGHIDYPSAWANHLEVIRQIQHRTGGFTEFVPLPFVHMGAPIYLRGLSRPGPTWDEVVLVHAIGRIAFDGLIPNMQASWVKLGLAGGARLLDAGCNDLGGTLMGEIITRSAGAAHGQEVTPEEFVEVITGAGRRPARRSTTYQIMEESYPNG